MCVYEVSVLRLEFTVGLMKSFIVRNGSRYLRPRVVYVASDGLIWKLQSIQHALSPAPDDVITSRMCANFDRPRDNTLCDCDILLSRLVDQPGVVVEVVGGQRWDHKAHDWSLKLHSYRHGQPYVIEETAAVRREAECPSGYDVRRFRTTTRVVKTTTRFRTRRWSVVNVMEPPS